MPGEPPVPTDDGPLPGRLQFAELRRSDGTVVLLSDPHNRDAWITSTVAVSVEE